VVRATLRQILYSLRSKPVLVEQIDGSLLLRWFIGLSINDSV
jgi:transposase